MSLLKLLKVNTINLGNDMREKNMNIIKKTCLINLLFLMTIVGFGLYPSLSNAQPDIVSVDPLTHKLNRTNFVGSVAVFKGLYIGTNEVLTTGAPSINTLATTNFVIGTSNGLWTATTNLVTRSTNTIWIATTNLVTSSIANIPPASIGAISNTPLGIANAGGLTNAWQNPASATNWLWTKTETEVTLTGYNFLDLNVVIPDMLDALPVTGFGTIFSPGQGGTAITSLSGGKNVSVITDRAFENCASLTSVIIGDGVTSIGWRAFYNDASLTGVTIGKSVTTIGQAAFWSCIGLLNVTIPNSVTTIGVSAFTRCETLTSVIVGNGVNIVGEQAFAFCDQLSSLTLSVNSPAEDLEVFYHSPNVTCYVTNPQATGWGVTWNGRPVVRLDGYFREITVGGNTLTTLLADKVTKSPITNEFSIPLVTTIPTNSPFLFARLNESQILTQLMSKAQSGSGATATVYVLPTFQSDFSAATSTNDILVNSSWNTTNISVSIPVGGGLALAVRSGHLDITNSTIFVRTVIP